MEDRGTRSRFPGVRALRGTAEAVPLSDGCADAVVVGTARHLAPTSAPADRDAAFARVRDYLADRPETASGAFTPPVVTAGLRALRNQVSRSPTSVRSGT